MKMESQIEDIKPNVITRQLYMLVKKSSRTYRVSACLFPSMHVLSFVVHICSMSQSCS